MSSDNARGISYEPYALAQHALKHPTRVIFCGKGGIPDALLARATGTPVTPAMTRELKRAYTTAVDEALAQGKKPSRLSEHFGMDGVSVDAKAWSMHTEDLLSSLHVLECKVGLADCHVLGPSIARQFTNLALYGPEKLPPLTLLSPHKPTPAVVSTFAPLNGAFNHEIIREAVSASSVPSASADAMEISKDNHIDPFRWQGTVARRTVLEWNKGSRICVASVVMGLGKTVAGWLTLKNADKQPLRLFCAHTTVVALQAIEEAKRLGIHDVLDLTHRHTTKAGVDAAVHGAADFSSDSSSDDDGDVAEEHTPGPVECARLIQRLTDLSQTARADKPVYAVLCHATLRALATHGLGGLKSPVALIIDESHKLRNGKAVCDAILSPIHAIRTLLMTATPPKTWDVGKLGKQNAKALVDAPVVMRLGLAHGIEMKRLVPTHVELVVAADAMSGEMRDAADATIYKKAEATAAWIVNNNLATVSVYATLTKDADAFSAALGPAIEAIAGGKSWCESVHSKKKAKYNDAALNHFKADTFSSDGVLHKVVVSVGQLKEGFNMPKLQAVVLLEPPDDAATVLQMCGRGMRCYAGKTMARVLVFGQEGAAASVGRMLHAYDREFKAITVGAVASTYDEQINTAVEGATRTALEAKSHAFQAKTRERLQNLALATCDNSTLRTAQVAAFVKQFADTKPMRDDGQKLTYLIDKVECRVGAGHWLTRVRGDWHNCEESYSLSDANKAALTEGVKWFDPPPSEKVSSSHTERVQQVFEFITAQKRLPNQKSSDAAEKTLGVWLMTLLQKGPKRSEKHVRKEVGDDAVVDTLLKVVATTPNSKQAADNTKTLQHVEDLAIACKALRGLEGRNPWPTRPEKPHGKFLSYLRQGQIGPGVHEDALGVVRRVLADPLDAKALAHLEASLSLSVSKHEEFKRKRFEIDAANRAARKRKAAESGIDNGSSSTDKPSSSPKRAK